MEYYYYKKNMFFLSINSAIYLRRGGSYPDALKVYRRINAHWHVGVRACGSSCYAIPSVDANHEKKGGGL